MDYARQQYNAVGDPLFGDVLLRNYIYDAEMALARESKCIRAVYTTSSVASQQEYPFPSRTIAIKRVLYGGYVVHPRSLDEVLNLTAVPAAGSGYSYIYAIWAETLYLGPIPSDVQTIKVFSFNEPSAKTANTSTMDTPDRYHLDIADFLLERMCIQDKNYAGAAVHAEKWRLAIERAKSTERKMMTGQGFSFVRDEDREFDNQLVIG